MKDQILAASQTCGFRANQLRSGHAKPEHKPRPSGIAGEREMDSLSPRSQLVFRNLTKLAHSVHLQYQLNQAKVPGWVIMN